MIKSLAHACILTNDLEKTAWFYGTVLGLQKRFDFKRQGQLIGYYYAITDSSFIEVFVTGADLGSKTPEKIHHFCLEVADIDALEAHLQAHGVAPRGKKLGNDHTWQLWCDDPNGIAIEFQAYTPQSTQFTGEDCHLD